MYSAVCFLFLPTGSTYEDEQKKQETNVIELQTVIDESEQQTFNIKCFLRLVKGYMELDRLTSEFLRMFVEKIVIHKPTKENCRRIHPQPEQDEMGALEFFLTWYDDIAGKVLFVGDRGYFSYVLFASLLERKNTNFRAKAHFLKDNFKRPCISAPHHPF